MPRRPRLPVRRRIPPHRKTIALPRPRASWPWTVALVPLALPVALLATAPAARAHDAPSGWSYPFSCCSGYDCRPVSAKTISERPEGYVIAGTGEVVGYGDERIRSSPDDEYHWCSVAGMDDGKTICLFVPQHLY